MRPLTGAARSSAADVQESSRSGSHAHTAGTKSHSRHNVHVLFLQDQRGDHILNRITSMIGRKVHRDGFCHVEISIPDPRDEREYLSSSIYNGEKVTLTRTKTFANPGYTVLTFTVDGNELDSMADYLYESHRMQLGFDTVGMYLATFPVQLNPFVSNRKTFCSKHVTMALKAANIEAVDGLNENIVTPSKLHRMLKERLNADRWVVGSVKFKQDAMLASIGRSGGCGTIFTIH